MLVSKFSGIKIFFYFFYCFLDFPIDISLSTLVDSLNLTVAAFYSPLPFIIPVYLLLQEQSAPISISLNTYLSLIFFSELHINIILLDYYLGEHRCFSFTFGSSSDHKTTRSQETRNKRTSHKHRSKVYNFFDIHYLSIKQQF